MPVAKFSSAKTKKPSNEEKDLRQIIQQKNTQLPARKEKERNALGPEVMINDLKRCKYIFSTYIFRVEGPPVEREIKEPCKEKSF